MPDYVLIFVKDGENQVPVQHPVGITEYAGATPMLPDMVEMYGNYEDLKKKYEGHEPKD
jgi:hypothetical protein